MRSPHSSETIPGLMSRVRPLEGFSGGNAPADSHHNMEDIVVECCSDRDIGGIDGQQHPTPPFQRVYGLW